MRRQRRRKRSIHLLGDQERMLFRQILFLSTYHFIHGLQCTDNCSMTYSMHQPLVFPSSCGSISASRCSVKLVFWHERGRYVVTFPGESSTDPSLGEQRQFLMVETAANPFFSYDINHVCKDTDDCARQFAERKVLEVTRQASNLSLIFSDLARVLRRKSTPSEDLACFDSNDGIRQCTVFGMIGSCQIIDDLVKRKFYRRSCVHSTRESAGVNIYDTGGFAMMTVKCNRMLCNGPLTLAAVKRILHRYNISSDDGRLPSRSSRRISTNTWWIFVLVWSIQ